MYLLRRPTEIIKSLRNNNMSHDPKRIRTEVKRNIRKWIIDVPC